MFTVEEINLMCVYNISSRTALMNALCDAMPDFDEEGMREIAETALVKLEGMSDKAFTAITLTPSYDFEDAETGS